MKKSILRCLISVTIILLALRANAQNDRIITSANDTIPCKIEASGIFSAYKYSSGGGEKIKITTERIKEFYNVSKTLWFRKIVVRHQPITFMKVLERGKISIYETAIGVNATKSEFWYASKNSDTAVFIHNDRIGPFTGNDKGRKLFAGLLEDKKAVYDQYIEIEGPDLEDMLRLAQLYNRLK